MLFDHFQPVTIVYRMSSEVPRLDALLEVLFMTYTCLRRGVPDASLRCSAPQLFPQSTLSAWLQDVTEENAELALGVKANKGLVPRAAQLPSECPHNCRCA